MKQQNRFSPEVRERAVRMNPQRLRYVFLIDTLLNLCFNHKPVLLVDHRAPPGIGTTLKVYPFLQHGGLFIPVFRELLSSVVTSSTRPISSRQALTYALFDQKRTVTADMVLKVKNLEG